MRATDGTTWLPIAESADRHSVPRATVQMWRYRQQIRSWKLDNRVWVCDDDVADMELLRRARVRAS